MSSNLICPALLWKSNLSGIEAVLKTECSCESGWGSSPQASSIWRVNLLGVGLAC